MIKFEGYFLKKYCFFRNVPFKTRFLDKNKFTFGIWQVIRIGKPY
jgi:hypothetical protein